MAGEPRQIVFRASGADRGGRIAEDDKVGFEIKRQFEPLRRLGAVEHSGYAGQFGSGRHHRFDLTAVPRIDAHKRAERPVMANKRIGDRTDNPRCTGAKPAGQLVLEKDNARLVVHAMIGGERHDRA